MFRLGVINDEVSQDFATVVNFVKEFNLHSIEIRSVSDKLPHELTDTDIDEMKRLLDDTDIEIIGVASPFFKCDIDNAAERKEHLDILKGCIRTAKAFDTNLIRTFVFWDTGETEARWDEIIASYDEPRRMIDGEGIVLGHGKRIYHLAPAPPNSQRNLLSRLILRISAVSGILPMKHTRRGARPRIPMPTTA